jgi:hypothetical protein
MGTERAYRVIEIGCSALLGIALLSAGLIPFITGLVLLSRGDIASSMPPLLIPLAVGAVLFFAAKTGPSAAKEWDERIAALLRKVADLLDATIDSPADVGSP